MTRLHSAELPCCFDREFIAAFVLGVAAVSFDDREANSMLGEQRIQTLPEFEIFDLRPTTSFAASPAFFFQFGIQLMQPSATYLLSVMTSTTVGRVSDSKPEMTPINSIWLLVVGAAPPESSFSLPVAGCRRMQAQPPGPGLPLHAIGKQLHFGGGIVRHGSSSSWRLRLSVRGR